ncbi:MAG: FHA domain-containing protein [Bdellovibrionales bacterium]|nr:FHA domain-containing protein [Bdellovibrionales bacterium]
MSTKTMQGCQFSLKCLDQRVQDTLMIDKKKILIGSGENADFRIQDKSVSSYHAFICLKGNEGFMVKDLYSEGGVFINGQRVEESFVTPGDVLTIGTLSFSIQAIEDASPVFNADETISPAAQIIASIQLPPREGLVFIDGEYCDIQFDESAYKPLTALHNTQFHGDYVELDGTIEPLEIAHNVKTKKLEIISYMNGMMMDISYLELKDGEYSLSPAKKSKYEIQFSTLAKAKIFSIKDGALRFFAQETISPSVSWDKISLNEPVFLTAGAEQLSLRFVDTGVKWKGIPLFHRDREFFKQAGKVFAGAFLPMLLLLFVSIPRPDAEKESVAVVYKIPEQMKKPTESQEKSEVKAEELTSKTENSGHKENEQNPTKVEFAAASQKQKVVAKAAAPAAAPAAPVQTTPVKAYEFKSSVAMNSLVGDAPKINTNGSASKASVKDASFNAGSADDGGLVAGADIGVSKFNGSDKKGSGSGSYGSRGLASKSGFDSSYLEPKTVVLGSMDPELLRKILREYIPQFRHCYQQELIGTSDKIKGVIDLNFTISAEGKVAKHNIRAKDARFSQKGIGCMGQVLSIIDFPKPKGGGVVDVRQPLNFFAETEKI